jgi:hypothetical protein
MRNYLSKKENKEVVNGVREIGNEREKEDK